MKFLKTSIIAAIIMSLNACAAFNTYENRSNRLQAAGKSQVKAASEIALYSANYGDVVCPKGTVKKTIRVNTRINLQYSEINNGRRNFFPRQRTSDFIDTFGDGGFECINTTKR